MSRVPLVRTPHRLLPDPRRVIAKPYLPGEDVAGRVIENSLSLIDALSAPFASDVSANGGEPRYPTYPILDLSGVEGGS